jgi:flagellar hook assembly protein FlgD
VSYNNSYDTKEAYLSIRNDNNDKNIFNPYQNERLTIKYGFKPGYSTKTIVRIYDLKGRLVYTPVNKVHSALGEYTWDGRDSNRELVDIGTYICQVEVVVRETGDKYITDQPIVVAGQLN